MRRRDIAKLCVLLLAGLAPAGAVRAETCAPDRLDIRGDWGTARFSIELAIDPADQARGLMFRERLAASAGMLFVYPAPGAPVFWMKNTLIPLDMLFIDQAGTVAHVHPQAVPGDLTGITGGPGILAVLEVRGGLAAAMGIGPGDDVRHPTFGGPEAAWPCGAEASSAGGTEAGPETGAEAGADAGAGAPDAAAQ